jgi:hypothetical protein
MLVQSGLRVPRLPPLSIQIRLSNYPKAPGFYFNPLQSTVCIHLTSPTLAISKCRIAAIECLSFIPIKLQQLANLPEQELQDRMPHISYQKSNEISLAQDNRLHISIYLRSLRVKAGSSMSTQINPFPLHNGAGDEDLMRGDDTGNPFRRQSSAEAVQPKLYQGENTSPRVCSHGFHDPLRSACPQCLTDVEAELQNAFQGLLRQVGWSGEQIKGLLEEEQRSNTNTPLSRLLPKGDGPYKARERDWQVSLLQEMNRRMERAKTWRRAIGRS